MSEKPHLFCFIFAWRKNVGNETSLFLGFLFYFAVIDLKKKNETANQSPSHSFRFKNYFPMFGKLRLVHLAFIGQAGL